MVFNRYWLCNYSTKCSKENFSPSLESLWIGNWAKNLSNPIFMKILERHFDETCLSENSCSDLLVVAISAVQAFVQDNFVGTSLESYSDYCEPFWSSVSEYTNDLATQYLMSDSEEINANIIHPELLAVAKCIFAYLKTVIDTDLDEYDRFICLNWKLRFLNIYQKVIDENTETLYKSIMETAEILSSLLKTVDKIDDHSKSLCLLEITECFLYYKRITQAKEKLKQAQQLLKVNISVEGKMGVRTKFQTKPVPQLMLNVEEVNVIVDDDYSSESPATALKLPRLLELDDEVLLERVQFVSQEDNPNTKTKGIIQALILTTFNYIQQSQPKDKLVDEELIPYINMLLYQEHGPWSIRISTLLANISMESLNKRTVERSLKQCEEIVKLITVADSTNSIYRLSYVYASNIRPIWLVRDQMANIMVSLGLIKTALDQYIQIERWNAVITCYNLLEMKHKAAETIQNELKKKETVGLYCLLGDALDDISFYEKAWQLSKQKSGRAQRHLGFYYFAKKQYEQAISHLEKSVEINSLQENVWARIGYSAIELKRWELAAKAYRHYTNIEPNGFESWNNLAKAYLNLGDKKRAHKILTEALRCNYNNWKVWENFLLISVDTGNFEDVLNAHYRLGELREKYLDKQVLAITINAICENMPDAQGRPSSRLQKKAQNHLAQLCVQYPSEGIVFELSAKLLEDDPLQKAQKLQKAYRAYTQVQHCWTNTADKTYNVLNICLNLCETSLKAHQSLNDKSKDIVTSQLSSAKLTAQGCIKAAKDSEWVERCKPLIESAENLLEQIREILLNKN